MAGKIVTVCSLGHNFWAVGRIDPKFCVRTNFIMTFHMAGGKLAGGKMAVGNLVGGKSTGGKLVGGKSIGGKTVGGKLVNDDKIWQFSAKKCSLTSAK